MQLSRSVSALYFPISSNLNENLKANRVTKAAAAKKPAAATNAVKKCAAGKAGVKKLAEKKNGGKREVVEEKRTSQRVRAMKRK